MSTNARVFALVAIVLLSGCAAQQTQPMGGIRAPKIEVTGNTKQELLACAGTPIRQEREEGVEFLTYSTAPVPTPGTAPGGLLQAKKMRSLTCEATIAIRNGIVSGIEYRDGAGKPAEPEQCAPLFERCKK
jgi:hypothetical protein